MRLVEAETCAVVLVCHVVCDVVGRCAVSVACHCGMWVMGCDRNIVSVKCIELAGDRVS